MEPIESVSATPGAPPKKSLAPGKSRGNRAINLKEDDKTDNKDNIMSDFKYSIY